MKGFLKIVHIIVTLLTLWLAQQTWVMLNLLFSEVQHEMFISQKTASLEEFIVKRQGNTKIRYFSDCNRLCNKDAVQA